MSFDTKEVYKLYEEVKNYENVKPIINGAYDVYNFVASEYPQTLLSAGLNAINFVSPSLLALGSAVHVGYNGLVHKDTMSNKAEIAQADYQIIASNIVHLAPLTLSLIGGLAGFGLPILIKLGVEHADKYNDAKIVETAESFVTEGLKHYLGNEFTHSTELYAGLVTAGTAFKAGFQFSSWLSDKAIKTAKNQADAAIKAGQDEAAAIIKAAKDQADAAINLALHDAKDAFDLAKTDVIEQLTNYISELKPTEIAHNVAQNLNNNLAPLGEVASTMEEAMSNL